MSLKNTQPALLVLEDDTIFRGRSYGALGSTFGEIVLNTGMMGYQEVLTDPCYAGQIVVNTYPHIGNVGVNDEDASSAQYWASGLIVRDPSRVVSSWRATRSLDEDLINNGIVGLQGIDTRALTHKLSKDGVMRAGIFSGEAAAAPREELLAQVRAQPSMEGAELVSTVTTSQPYSVGPADFGIDVTEKYRVNVLDLGVNRSLLRNLAAHSIRATVLPANSSLEEIKGNDTQGVIFAGGPGDPAASPEMVELARELIKDELPFFGIGLGHQFFALALGFHTYKLPLGHRAGNLPVFEIETGKTTLRYQNHGFAVEAPVTEPVIAPNADCGTVSVTHYTPHDNVIEGLTAQNFDAFSVQFYPLAAPDDGTDPVIVQFTDLIKAKN